MFSVSYPRGDIFRQVGTDDRVELFCHLNPAHSYFKKVRLVSSKIFFVQYERHKETANLNYINCWY